MIGVRPPNSDWDAIAQLTGDASWSSANMSQFFDVVGSWLNLEMPDPTLAISDPKILGVVVGAVNAYVSGHGGVDLDPGDLIKVKLFCFVCFFFFIYYYCSNIQTLLTFVFVLFFAGFCPNRSLAEC
jgi:hypothetical protein